MKYTQFVSRILFLCIPIIFTSMLAVAQQKSSRLPEGTAWEPYPPMSDEFNAIVLDTSKWHPVNPSWRGRPPVHFHEECISIKDGILKIAAFDSHSSAKFNLPDTYTHVSGFIKSRKTARFGYFEIRAKLMNASLVSGFWLNRNSGEEWSEITIIEVPAGIDKFKDVLNPNVHYFYGPHYKGTVNNHLVEPSTISLGFNSTADFHVYGFEWSPSHLRWYIDGELVRESRNRHYFQPLNMNINVESNPYFSAFPIDEQLPSVYEVDWVRAWRPAKEFVPLED